MLKGGRRSPYGGLVGRHGDIITQWVFYGGMPEGVSKANSDRFSVFYILNFRPICAFVGRSVDPIRPRPLTQRGVLASVALKD